MSGHWILSYISLGALLGAAFGLSLDHREIKEQVAYARYCEVLYDAIAEKEK